VITESRRLRDKVELVLPLLGDAGRRLVCHPRFREIYPEWLVLWHGMIRASVPLLETAFAAAAELPEDPVAVRLADYYAHHVPEERGHDEWLLADLASLGISRDEVLRRVPSPTVAALVGSQYYWVQHVHPVGLIGYIALLEGYPTTRQDIDRLQSATGFGPEAFRTLLLHADLDVHHGEELDDLVDSLPMSDQQRELVGLSALASVQLMARAQDELLDRW
jgi:Iron-containing redox enzyme